MGGHQDSLAAHAGPTHPPESPHVRSGPSSGGREPEEEAEGAGLALRLAAEVCSGLRVPGELEVQATGAGVRSPAGMPGGARTLDPGRAEIAEGAGHGRPRGPCCHCCSCLFSPCSEFGKSFRMDRCGDLLLPRQLVGPPAPRHPLSSPLASRAVPALPRPAGRARRRADYISPGLVASCSRSRGCRSPETRATSGTPPPTGPPRGR